MTVDSIGAELGIYGGTLVICFISGLVPVVAGQMGAKSVLYFTSASVGLPPLYVTTLLAGGLGYRFRSFLAIGMLGRVARFAVIVALAWSGAS